MLEFSVMIQNAQNLVQKLTRSFVPSVGCFGFFSMVPQMLTSGTVQDAETLSLFATTLASDSEAFKKHIANYIKLSTPFEFEEFQKKILIGMYIYLCSQYNSSISYYLNRHFIALIKKELQISELAHLSQELYSQSLEALSHYCSFIYQNRFNGNYKVLHERLGSNIQLIIHEIERNTAVEPSLNCFSGVMYSLGLSNMP